MSPIIVIAAALALAVPGAALAKGPDHCPPGLAKKNPPCVPPGLAKKWRVGDRYDGDWDPVRDWRRYDLSRPRRGEDWIRVSDDVMLRVDDETRMVISIIRLADLLTD